MVNEVEYSPHLEGLIEMKLVFEDKIHYELLECRHSLRG
jgi:hypothetical protein